MRHGIKKEAPPKKKSGWLRTHKALWISCAAVLLCAAVALTLALTLSDTAGKCPGGARWRFEQATGTLYLSGKGGTGDMDLASDGPAWARYADRITSLVVQNGVTSIGSSAFDGDFLPEGIRYGIRTVSLPESVTEIGDCAFYHCVYLETVSFSGVSQLERIGSSAFYGCASLLSIRLPEGLSDLGEAAFEDCTALTAVTVPGTVKTLTETFAGCTALSQVLLGEGVEDIGYGTFSHCEALTGLPLPTTIRRIGEYAFWYSGLMELVVPISVTELGEGAFGKCTDLRSLVLGSPMSLVPDRLCYGNIAMEHLSLPAGVVQIGSEAFRDCRSIRELTLPEGVREVGDAAFYGCSGAESLTLPESLTTIGAFAFGGCGMQQAEIPESVATMGEGAFADCAQLSQVRFYPEEITLGPNVFEDCMSLSVIQVPKAAMAAYETALVGYTVVEGGK